MNQISIALIFTFGLFFGMLTLLEVGRRIGSRRLANDPEGARAGTGAVDGAVFALLGLLIAFTFSGAASRFDLRRNLLVEETNAIGTAWLRLDLLPISAQPAIRESFRQYVDTRLKVYRQTNIDAAQVELDKATVLQGKIWNQAVAAGQMEGAPSSATMLLSPALNQMIDITTVRTMETKLHPPSIIFVMLAIMALASALLAGYNMAGGKSRGWLHIICFSAITAVAVYVILDIEYPRLGLIRVDAFDQAMVQLRASMK